MKLIIEINFSLFWFSSDIKRDFNGLTILEEKFGKLNDLLDSMSIAVYKQRPNCREILSTVSEWALDANDIIESDLDLNRIPDILKETQNQFLLNYFLSKKSLLI